MHDSHLVSAHSGTKHFIIQLIAVILTLEKHLSDVMKPAFQPNPIELDPGLLSPSNVFDLLSKDHECFVYDGLFQQLDTSQLEDNYSVPGQHAYHPKLIVSILIYLSRWADVGHEASKRRREADLPG